MDPMLWTMIFTGIAAAAGSIYAGLTAWLLWNAQNATRASTLVQLVTSNRYLTERAAGDAELLAVIMGAVTGKLTPKQYSYVSQIASHVMCCFECSRLGALSPALFGGIKTAFTPMLRSVPVKEAIIDISGSHPELKALIEGWAKEAGETAKALNAPEQGRLPQ